MVNNDYAPLSFDFNERMESMREHLLPLSAQFYKQQQDREDLVSDAILKAFEKKHLFKPSGNENGLKSWVYVIMKRIFINRYRRNKKSRIQFDNTENQVMLNNPCLSFTESLAHNRLLKEDLEKAVKTVNYSVNKEYKDGYCKPLLMHTQGYKYQEIADEYGLPLGTVKARIFNAKNRIKNTGILSLD